MYVKHTRFSKLKSIRITAVKKLNKDDAVKRHITTKTQSREATTMNWSEEGRLVSPEMSSLYSCRRTKILFLDTLT